MHHKINGVSQSTGKLLFRHIFFKMLHTLKHFEILSFCLYPDCYRGVTATALFQTFGIASASVPEATASRYRISHGGRLTQ